MEIERLEKLSVLYTTFANLTEDQAKVEKARIGLARIFSEVVEAKNDILLLQAIYQNHLYFSRGDTTNSPGERIQSLNPRIKHFRQMVEAITNKVFFLSEQLRDANNDLISAINRLEKKLDLIKYGEEPDKLKVISVAPECLVDSSLLLITNVLKSEWEEMELAEEVKDVKEELNILIEEERAQLKMI